MKEMIYYPGFEVKDETWLKFALLYFDSLRPIIPYMPVPESAYLSDSFRRVMDETDLINPYRPEYSETTCASVLVCEEFEKYLDHPERYGEFFGRPHANKLLEKWRNPSNQDCTLFEGKYSYTFFDFCIESKIATKCNEGIKISKDLAFVYMCLLADVISRNNGLEMITDNKRYSAMLLKNNTQVCKTTRDNLKIAENNIELALPDSLSHIPIEKIIRLRRQKDFNDLRKAYMKEIGKLIDNRENKNSNYSLGDILSCKKDFIKICEHSFNMIASVTVSIFSSIALADGIQGAELIVAVASAYMDVKTAKDAASELPQFIKELKTKRQARKYVAKIHELNEPYRGYHQ